MLFGLAVWVTFCDLSISTSRGWIFSQGRHFSLEKPVWTINSKCTLRELVSTKLSAISLINDILNMSTFPQPLQCPAQNDGKGGFRLTFFPRMHISNVLYFQN